MGKIKVVDITIKDKVFKVIDKLTYRLSCQVEILNMQMLENIEIDMEEIGEDFTPKSFKDLKGFDFSKKQEIMDLLLVDAVKIPNIQPEDLENDEHELQEYFKDLAETLMERYTEQFLEIGTEKKKLTK